MNKLISGFVGVARKLKNSDSGEGSNLIQTGLSVLAKIGTLKLTLILIPIFAIMILIVGVTSIFGQELYQVQMSVGSGGGTSSIGKGIYSKEDLEDAVNVGNTSIKGGSYEGFVNSLSGTSFNDVNGFNEFIKSNVNKAGFGTREGVIAAALALCYELPKETGSRYFYTKPGALTHNGMALHEGITESTYMDCREFVQWALYNGGYKANELDWMDGVKDMGTVRSDVRTAQPGDIFATSGYGHIWLVVAVDENGYYAAEEYSGAEVNYYTWDNAYNGYGANLYDMSSYYNNPDNVRST